MPTLSERSKPGMQKWQGAKQRVLAAKPGTSFKVDWHTQWTKEEFFQEYYEVLDKAINARAGVAFKGRKFDSDYQTNLLRDKQAIENRLQHRIIVRQFNTPEVTKRFSHLLTTREDF